MDISHNAVRMDVNTNVRNQPIASKMRVFRPWTTGFYVVRIIFAKSYSTAHSADRYEPNPVMWLTRSCARGLSSESIVSQLSYDHLRASRRCTPTTMNRRGSTKSPRSHSKSSQSKDTPNHDIDVPITNEQLSLLTIAQLVSALLSKINSSDTRTCIAEARSSSSVVAEIEQLQMKLAHLAIPLKICPSKMQRKPSRSFNTLLPPEILVAIFHEVYLLPTDFPPSICDYPQPDDLIAISHVCSYWRKIALARPSLWSTIHVSGRRSHYATFLQRSMGAPLRIFVSLGNSNGEGHELSHAIGAVGIHSRRFIECHVRSDAPSSDVLPLLRLPAPSLERFSSAIDGNQPFPATLADPAPRLRKLAYSLDNVHWFATHCTSLTHLSLHWTSPNFPTITSILGALRHTPLLKVLAINLVSARDTQMDVVLQPVFLDHLCRLEFGGFPSPRTTSLIAGLVDFLVVPPNSETRIWLNSFGYPPSPTISTALSAIRAGSRYWSNLAQITRIDVSPNRTVAAMSIKGSRMILSPRMSEGARKSFPLPTWFEGQVKEIVIWDDLWTFDCSVNHYVAFLRSIPQTDTLTVRESDVNMILQAAEIVRNKENASVQESLRDTTDEQVVGTHKTVPRIQSLSSSKEAQPCIFPTELFAWLSV